MKITKRSIEAIKGVGTRSYIWDDDLPGFGLKVEATGRKTFVCRYRIGAVRRQYTIGQFGPLTVDQARTAAKRILGAVSLGDDPSAVKQAKRKAPRFKDLIEAYLEGHGPKLKPSTRAEYERSFRNHALPALGNRVIETMTVTDISRLHLKLSHHPYLANRVLAYIGSAFSWGQRNGWVEKGFNPVEDVGRFKEASRERYLTTEELGRLGAVLRQAETDGLPWEIKATGDKAKHVAKTVQKTIYPPHVTGAIRLLLLTGCRLREILNARWQDVDFQRGLLWLPDSKTGRRSVLLSAPAAEVLDSLPRLGSCIIPGTDPDRPRHDLKKPWDHVKRLAGLEDVRLHDLRHTHASIGAGAGLGLPIVGGLLGHRSPQTTQRYAHLADDPMRRAAERIGDELGKAIKG